MLTERVGKLPHAKLELVLAGRVKPSIGFPGAIDAVARVTYLSYKMYEQQGEDATGRVTVSEAREDFAELVNRVAYGGERVRIERRGREVAAIVPIEDADLLEQLEDQLDLEAAREALADPANAVPIPWEQVKRELGL